MGNNIKPFDFYLMRLPAKSINTVLALNKIENRSAFIQEIYHRYQSGELQDAIYLASPELYAEVKKWLDGPADAVNDKLLVTLYKYLLRMGTRATPYGLFSGYHTGEVTEKASELKLKEPGGRLTQYTRLDMNYISELVRSLLKNDAIKGKLIFTVNNSLYKIGGVYRYFEYKFINKKRHYYVVAIKHSRYIQCLIEKASAGASYQFLLDALTQLNLNIDEAKNYLDSVIDAQILVSELEPTVTGDEFYKKLIHILKSNNPDHSSIPALTAIENHLLGPKDFVKTCNEVHHIIKENFPLSHAKDLVQTDLHIGMDHNHINSGVMDILAAEMQSLSVLNENKTPARIKNFIKKFTERYEDQEIELLEALDNDAGVGYDKAGTGNNNHAPLIDDLVLNSTASVKNISWTSYRELVFNKFLESSKNQGSPVVLTDNDLNGIRKKEQQQIPSTFYAIGNFVSRSTESLDNGDFKFNLSACCGPSALPLLARFAQNDTFLTQKLKECALFEEKYLDGAVIAEIVHLPDSRVGNILQRPQLREYEIPFLGTSSLPNDQQMPVSDLMISVSNNEIKLRSKRLNKMVIPRLSSAHNYNNGIAVYKFLCDLQHQHGAYNINWDWGILNDQPYLPRVEYKHFILSRARWKITPDVYAEVKAIDTAQQLNLFLAKYKLPTKVVSIEGDRELLIDFTSVLGLELLTQNLKKNTVILYEFLHEDDHALMLDNAGEAFINEVIIPFRKAEPAEKQVNHMAVNTHHLPRKFNLGSEWTYVKIYCGSKWAEKILTDYMLPLVNTLTQEGRIEKWFFLRYHDPEGHLRIRFLHPDQPETMANIVSRINDGLKQLAEERIVHKIQYDTYKQEVERYGTNTMTFSESVFYHDSKAIINFLNMIEGDEGEYYRWLFAARSIDLLMGDFGLGNEQKLKLASRMQQAFFSEFGGNAGLTLQLNNKYRTISKALNGFLNGDDDTEEVADAVNLFKIRSAENIKDYDAIRTEYALLHPDLDLDAELAEILPSYIHMSLNRIFVTKQRMHELVIYHYLTKYYQGILARNKQKTLTPNLY
ncbi:lantibiotic dehydratase [Pedobacter zeae]|uniref:Lantibiotic dehydratase n=1 Tax=Pedobacter zeae TaxID=1737356 RepID=A0A7W6KD87_9SPHI|nr:lantibiotic dehydratase [Pedobacter zeae]MBB4109668.1 thiopeptide-type bacteriocin biosynthesis protein [Pedobacter zeae]GGH13542.1 lantibiotic dehydratase [Pedobacter zeae]